MTELTLSQQETAKAFATEIVLLALLREKREDPAFWQSLEKLTAVVMSMGLAGSEHEEIRQMAEKAQEFLDSWRQIAGEDPKVPAPPGSLPFDPPPT